MKKNDTLRTPKYIIDALGKFDLDPCAGEKTQIGKINWWEGRSENGLSNEWIGFVFCNPPFSEKELWIEKMIKHRNGILLLPERGSAPWFGKLAEQSDKYFVIGKKINFDGGSSSSNIGSVFFLFGEEAIKRINESGLPGHLVHIEWFKPRGT